MAIGTDVPAPAPPFRLRLHPLEEPIAIEASAAEPPPPGAELALPVAASGIVDQHALRLLREAARLEPNDADYHYIVGLALTRAGRLAAAADAFREAVSLHRGHAEYFQAYGTALWEMGRDEEAADAFREVLRLRPDHPSALNGLACALTRVSREAEAVALFHEALRGSHDANLHGNLAIALWRAGRRTEAMKAFTAAVRRQPRAAHWRREMARALCALGRPSDAARCLQQIGDYRSDVHVLLDIAEATYDARRFAEARRALDDAVAADAQVVALRPRAREIRSALQVMELRQELGSPRATSGLLAGLVSAVSTVGRWTMPRAVGSGAVIALAFVGLYVVARFVPVYFRHHLFHDDVAGIASAAVTDDADIHDRIQHAVRDRRLTAYVKDDTCRVETKPKWRRIVCRYRVPVDFLPGWRREVAFEIDVERPYLKLPELPLGF